MVNMNSFKFGDKLKMSNGEMGIYAGGYTPTITIPNDHYANANVLEDVHNVIVQTEKSFAILELYDNGSGGDITVVGRWEET